MVAIRFIRHRPDGQAQVQEVSASVGQSVMRAAVDAAVDGIAADCGGVLVCATCHVYVPSDWAPRLPPPSDDERSMLDFTAAPRRDGSRLCCQLIVDASLEGLTLELPETQY